MADTDQKTLEGQVALVTGASRGIGRAIATSLAAAGADVIAAARTEDAVRETVEAIRKAGGKVAGIAVDVADDDSVAAALDAVKEEHAKISILVNNAGVTRDTLLLRMKKEDWDFVIGTNLDGVYRLTKALAPVMIRARYGRIVNVTSVVGAIGNPGQGNYAASKAGIEGFTRSMARELASRNITVNCVAPGFIDTDMTKALDEKTRESLLSQVPMNRLGTAQDVADAVMFLLGEEASYITGSILHVNGGMYM
jgi:3-oxoacyl-[acyl-carrier protein] reductase